MFRHVFPSDRWLWSVLVTTTLLSILGFGLAAWWLAQGRADPPGMNTLQWEDSRLDWINKPSTTAPSAQSVQVFTAPLDLPEDNQRGFSLEAMATISTGLLNAWGLWLETANGDRLVVGISGAQYVTARLCPMPTITSLLDCPPLEEPNQHILTVWKTFHHIRPVGQANRIRLDYLPGRWADGVTLRLNGEWMWDLPYQTPVSTITWGIWTMHGNNQPPIIDWHHLRLWADKPVH